MIWVATAPASLPGEHSHINSLMLAGLKVLLLRKPGFSALQYEQLLEGIDPIFHSRIMIAGQPELVTKYGLMGLHMSEAFRSSADVESYRGWKLSTSVHEEEAAWSYYPPERKGAFVEIKGVDDAIGDNTSVTRSHASLQHAMYQYLILGPVFNSISKPGYMGRLQEMKNIPPNALAIGGITEKNIGLLPDAGFCGVVLLGVIWNDPFNAVHTYQSIKAAWNRT